MHTYRIARRSLLLTVCLALTLIGWGGSPSQSTRVADASLAAQMLPVESLLNSDGTLNTNTGASGALDLRGWSVTLDSARGPILTRDAPNADTWSALAHNGLNNEVTALAVVGSDLYVGGYFTQTVDGMVTNLNFIAKYSGGAWAALAHNGLDHAVLALAVSGTDLYVGGDFTQTADSAVTNLNYIAKYSGGGWSALANNGLDNEVDAFAVIGSDLYVGGFFTQTADGIVTNLNKIAKFSGGTWSALAHNGLIGVGVVALAVIGSDLYVGGRFTATADGMMTNLNCIAKYSGGAWSALPHNGLNNWVNALAVSGTDLYVGGYFTQTVDASVTNLNWIAKYSGGAWSTLAHNGLSTGLSSGFIPGVYALTVSGSDLYVGGRFTKTADGTVINLNNIAKYSSGTWSALANNGLNGWWVNDFAASGSDLYVGGYFTQTADGTVMSLNYIAKLEVSAVPGIPSLLTPPNGTLTTTQAITLAWEAGAGGTPVGYNVQVDSDKVVTVTGTLSATLLSEGVHTWTVRAYNAAGYSEWATPWTVELRLLHVYLPLVLKQP